MKTELDVLSEGAVVTWSAYQLLQAYYQADIRMRVRLFPVVGASLEQVVMILLSRGKVDAGNRFATSCSNLG